MSVLVYPLILYTSALLGSQIFSESDERPIKIFDKVLEKLEGATS